MVDRRAAALVIVLVFGIFVLIGRRVIERSAPGARPVAEEGGSTGTPETPPDPDEVWRVPFGGAPSRGPADALVTLIVFTDLKPGAGARLEALAAEVVREQPDDVRFGVRILPSAETQLAAEALMAAHMQGRYFEMRAALGDRAGGALTRSDVDEAARSVGLDTAVLAAALDGGKATARARADGRQAATIGATTPTVLVNGQKVPGNVTAAELDRVVARQKAKAEALVRRGTPRERVYMEITRAGRTDVLQPGLDRAPRRREDPDAVYRVEIGESPARGPADALVTVIEFGDFQDPFSARAERILSDLIERHAAEMRLVWKDAPLSTHPEAQTAAVAARAAHAQGRFWPMHDGLFESQDSLGRETYERLARQLHLDMERFHADMGSDRLGKAISQERAAAEPLGVVVPPVFFVNGKRLRGLRSGDELVTLVERELERARALVRSDRIRPADVYDHLTRNGARRSVFVDER